LRTLSSASPRCRMVWNLSNRIAACDAFEARKNSFHACFRHSEV
jgi:hypothetical protein